MSMKAIKAKAVFTESGIEKEKLLLLDGDRFGDLLAEKDVREAGIEIAAYPDLLVLPGLFDSHIHGALGCDTMDANAAALDTIGRYLLSAGTTSWMPTTVTSSLEAIENALEALGGYHPAEDAARVTGCFVEGPYLTAEHRGAHPVEYLRELSISELEGLLARGPVKALAVAPEKAGAAEFIRHAADKGVHISLAHTSASYEEAVSAIENGADASVHTYCGMSPLHHRSPGLLGAALIRDDVYAELIADGIHVQKPAMEILLRCKPGDKVILVSDAISATGLPDGDYVLGVEPVHVEKGIPRTGSGSLAGSTANLLDEVRRLIVELGREPLSVVHMASLNPCRRFGLEDELGSIRRGKRADFLLVNERYELQQVWKDGCPAIVKRPEAKE